MRKLSKNKTNAFYKNSLNNAKQIEVIADYSIAFISMQFWIFVTASRDQ